MSFYSYEQKHIFLTSKCKKFVLLRDVNSSMENEEMKVSSNFCNHTWLTSLQIKQLVTKIQKFHPALIWL